MVIHVKFVADDGRNSLIGVENYEEFLVVSRNTTMKKESLIAEWHKP